MKFEGNIRMIKMEDCKHCLGTGLVLNTFYSIEEEKSPRFMTCPKCKGHGFTNTF